MSGIGHCQIRKRDASGGYRGADSTDETNWRSLVLAKVPSGGAMRSFIHRKNLEIFRKPLVEAEDEPAGRRLRKLLAEEEAKERPAPRRPEDC